jgi:dTDP-4-amino-4,6-dideoxygalactose transaminase
VIKFLDLKAQYDSIRPEIDAAIAGVLDSASFIGGAEVQAFEKEFAAYQQADHCIGVANATDGLEIAIEALGLPAGSEILVPANSFIASSEAVTRSGHRVRFFDADATTYLATAEGIERALTPATKAVVVVHLYGQPADMAGILAVAKARRLRVIEDAAQAHGAELNGRRIGALGDIGVFSFYPGKNLGAYGDAGALVTNDPDLAKRARMIANHGRIAKYDHEFEGRNSRLDSLQAAILRVKLRHLDGWIDRRNAVAARYLEVLPGIGDLVLPRVRPGVRHAYHLFVVRTKHREPLQAHLKAAGIETGIHYPVALPDLAAYAYLGDAGRFEASRLASQLLSLPMGEHLSPADADAVAAALAAFRAP